MDTDKNIEKLITVLKDLVSTYEKAKRTNDPKEKEDIKELYLVRAGKGLEALVFYIVKREKLNVVPKTAGQEITLDDHLFHLRKNNIFNKTIADDFYNIKNWRNKNSHFQDPGFDAGPLTIRDSTIETVYDSFKEILKWFFEIYLKGEYADFSKNLYGKKEKAKEPTNEEIEEIKKNFERNPLNIPDFSILNQSKKVQRRVKKKNVFLSTLITLAFVLLGYVVYTNFFASKENKTATLTATKAHLTKDQVLGVIHRFLDSYNDANFDADLYFANHVDCFITSLEINNPTKIEVERKKNTEYIDPKTSIDASSLELVAKNDSISYWRFSGEYHCYRRSLKKFQKCNVLMEYGINTEGKITRIKQISSSNYHFSKDRPS